MDPTYLAFSSPWTRPLHFVGLELLVLTCFALTLHHAWSSYRRGERYALFQWLVVFGFGILMELIAFNYYPSYDHGQFTVQLYHRKLPLYITGDYLLLYYTGLQLAERLRLGRIAEPLVAGLAVLLIDVPMDLVGVDARWWSWSATDKNVDVQWLGVPLTSFYFYLVFGTALAALTRALRRTIEPRSLAAYLGLAPLVAAGTVVGGILGFLPYHGLKALGVPDGVIVAAHVAVCLAIVAARGRPWSTAAARQVRFIPLAVDAWCLGVLLVLSSRGAVVEQSAQLLTIAAATLASLLLVGPLTTSRVAVATAGVRPQPVE
jgi:hypothetical protein